MKYIIKILLFMIGLVIVGMIISSNIFKDENEIIIDQRLEKLPTKIQQLTFESGADKDPFLYQKKDMSFQIVWSSNRNGNFDIWQKNSIDGINWGKTELAFSSEHDNLYPSFAQSIDGTSHLVWFQQDSDSKIRNIMYSKKKNRPSWTRARPLAQTETEDLVPVLFEDLDGILWIVWSSSIEGNKDIFLMVSGDKGSSWSEPLQVTTSEFEDDFPYLFQKNDRSLLMIWSRYDKKKGNWIENPTSEIFYATSKFGMKWSEPIQITNDEIYSQFMDIMPIIYSDYNNQLYAAWSSNRKNFKGSIVSVKLNEGIINYIEDFSPGQSPRIIRTNLLTNLFVYVDGPDNNLDIFYKYIK